jgi:sugar/nucleoside kinase (ribokinase family)
MTHRRVVAFGEALIDLVASGPDEGDTPQERVPRFGGSVANIAVGAARFGARTAFVGGAGDDRWGRWLAEALRDEGVDASAFKLRAGAETPRALVDVGAMGEPRYRFLGDREACVTAAAGALAGVLEGPPGVFVCGSDTLIGGRERSLTRRALLLARSSAWTVLYDPNLRSTRWPSEAEMIATVTDVLAAASVVKANTEEAMLLSGAGDPESAAAALLAAGPRAAVVTLGADGALLALRGQAPTRVPAPAAPVVDTTGAGDAIAAVVAAALAAEPATETVAAALPLAVEVAAKVVAATGALDGLPDATAARRSLDAALRRSG